MYRCTTHTKENKEKTEKKSKKKSIIKLKAQETN